MICFKCGEENSYGSRVCCKCSARLINIPAVEESRKVDIKESGAKGDPFCLKIKKFEYTFPYMTGNFSRLVRSIEDVLNGSKDYEALKKNLEEIEKGAKHYLYKAMPAIEKKIEAPGAANYRHILELASRLNEEGFYRFLEAADEIKSVFSDGYDYHLEKGLEICYKANNLVSLGCVLAEKFHRGEDIVEIQRQIDEYLASEKIFFD